MDDLKNELLNLLSEARARFPPTPRFEVVAKKQKPQPKDYVTPFPEGAHLRQIVRFSRTHNIELPPSLRTVLELTNPASGFFGITPARKSRRIEDVWELYPNWLERGWFPVASDTFGNYFVQPFGDNKDERVWFVDVGHDSEKLERVVATDVLRLLYSYLHYRLGGKELSPMWPFNPQHTRKFDPDVFKNK